MSWSPARGTRAVEGPRRSNRTWTLRDPSHAAWLQHCQTSQGASCNPEGGSAALRRTPPAGNRSRRRTSPS
eukprot:11202649-Lingulodinium_polyedra.AAC.1